MQPNKKKNINLYDQLKEQELLILKNKIKIATDVIETIKLEIEECDIKMKILYVDVGKSMKPIESPKNVARIGN